MTRILGAIIAGGRSQRFGTDKALAYYRGRTLIDQVERRLAPQVDDIVVCGRDVAGRINLLDRPGPGLGPLAGINAALHYARNTGFTAVLTVPCDTPILPADLLDRLVGSGLASFVAELPVIALWPVALAVELDDYFKIADDRSVRSAAIALGALAIHMPIANVNTPADLAALSR